MSARNIGRSVIFACLGTLTGATSVLASTGKIHLTAQAQATGSSNLEQALGSLTDSNSSASATPTAQQSTPTGSGSTPTTTQSSHATHTVKATPTKPAGPSGTFVGNTADDGWANFKVQLTVSGGKVTDAQVVNFSAYNGGSRIGFVSGYLREQVLTTKSVDCSQIGGATYSCMAYADSLSSAVSRAGI